jgi:DNA segregation ATPase FtsK/SpoIIIE, S-DNA-T family
MSSLVGDVLAIGILVLVARFVYALIRFICYSPAAKRNYLPAVWAKLRWRWMVRNQGLAYLDTHRPRAPHPKVWGTSVRVRMVQNPEYAWLRFPRARIRPDDFGLVAQVRTVPRAGARKDFEDAAPYIADHWRCVRVQVRQPKPGRLIVRGLRTDPLVLPFTDREAPAGVFGTTPPLDLRNPRLYVGRDEWGQDRWLPLSGVTGITVGGLPGFGKTELIRSWITQLSGLPVRFIFIDGKGSGDYREFADRAWISAGDELSLAAATLEHAHTEMRRRLGLNLPSRNLWHAGLSPEFPLVVTVIDECHTFFDLDAAKGERDRSAEQHVRACRTLAGQLVRKGRSVLFLTLVITQKQTSDAIPTAIRDNCRAGFCFAVKTRDAAIASLGEHIREYPSFCPTTLQDEAYVGVCTISLKTNSDPFVRIRVPQLTAAASESAQTHNASAFQYNMP